MHIEEDYPLAPRTTFEIGGHARYFVAVKNESEVREAFAFAKERTVPIFMLGGGSNILVSDNGFLGLVIHNEISGFSLSQEGEKTLATIGAGENWDEIVRRVVEKNLSGIECLSGVPGSAGGAVVQNIGAYGQGIDAVVKEVVAIDMRNGEQKIFTNQECGFAYRTSIFKKKTNPYFVVRATLALAPNAKPTLAYHDVVNYFADRSHPPTLKEVRNAVIEIRARKGYVLLPGYEQYRTAGSFFKNPVVSSQIFQNVSDVLAAPRDEVCPKPWFWKLEDSMVKISAACLLSKAGFTPGYRKGNVGISPKHPLALMNYGKGTAKEIVSLSDEIKNIIRERFGVDLEEEIVYV